MTTPFQIFSDLHLEHYMSRMGGPDKFLDTLPVAAPNLILAGDIGHLGKVNKQWMEARIRYFLSRWETVYYIPGNHEFYGSSIPEGHWVLNSLTSKRFKYLGSTRRITKGGLRLWGDTMWFPEPDPKPTSFPVNDFYYITGFKYQVYKQHADFNKRLRKIKPDVVVTHHLPSFKSVGANYGHSDANWCYVADQEAYILEHKPKLWIHGHTHDPCDYMIGETRVICNAHGYPGQTSSKFRKDLVVEL